MMNLNEMTSKQLKDLGKQHGVKNWWNLNKAALISALSEIDSHESEQMNVKVEVEEKPEVETEIEVEVSASAETDSSEVEQTNTKAKDKEMTKVETGIDDIKPNTLIQTAPPERIIAFVEVEEPKKKKPNLKIHELTFEGKTQSIRAWAEELEMPWPTLYDRVNRCGWTTEEALTIPLGGRRQK